MAMSGGKDDGSPMIEMNMTPLIDVLLVLLIMFIITIPVATHSVDIDLPLPNPNPSENIDPIKNKIVITQTDELLWNGTPIDESTLVANLQQTLSMQPEPELQFEPDALASYERAARTLDLIKRTGVTKFGFVGNERYREFGKAAGAQ